MIARTVSSLVRALRESGEKCDGESSPWMRRWADSVAILFLVVGAGLRLRHWLAGRGLWQDEAYLAVNVQSRDLAGLAQPLELNQSAPYLFLAFTDLLTLVFGEGERVLRLLPLLASLAGLVLFWRLVRPGLGPAAAALGVAILAFLYPLVYYAQEFKQYSIEVLVVVVVLYFGARIHRDPARAGLWFAWLAGFGAIGIFLAHTAPFVLGGAGLACALGRRAGYVSVTWPRLFAVGALWGGLFALNYAMFIRPAEANEFMRNYWAFAFPPAPWTLAGVRAWYALANEFVNYLGYTGFSKGALLVFGIAGIASAWRHRNGEALAACLGLVCFGVAVMLGKAPLYGRLGLFLVPMGFLVVLAGWRHLLSGRAWWLAVIGVPLLLAPLRLQLIQGLQPIVVENQREVIDHLVRKRQPDEPVYVVFYAQPGLIYYRSRHEDITGRYYFGTVHRRWEPPPRPGKMPPRSRADLERSLAEIGSLTKHPRFWVLLAHMDAQEAELIDQVEKRYGYVRAGGLDEREAGVFLFERR